MHVKQDNGPVPIDDVCAPPNPSALSRQAKPSVSGHQDDTFDAEPALPYEEEVSGKFITLLSDTTDPSYDISVQDRHNLANLCQTLNLIPFQCTFDIVFGITKGHGFDLHTIYSDLCQSFQQINGSELEFKKRGRNPCGCKSRNCHHNSEETRSFIWIRLHGEDVSRLALRARCHFNSESSEDCKAQWVTLVNKWFGGMVGHTSSDLETVGTTDTPVQRVIFKELMQRECDSDDDYDDEA